MHSVSNSSRVSGLGLTREPLLKRLRFTLKKPSVPLFHGTTSGSESTRGSECTREVKPEVTPVRTELYSSGEYTSSEISRAILLEDLKLQEEVTSTIKSGELLSMLISSPDNSSRCGQNSGKKMTLINFCKQESENQSVINVSLRDEGGTLIEKKLPIDYFLPQYQEMEIIKENSSLLLGHVQYHLDNMGSPEWQTLVTSHPIDQYPHFYPSKQEIETVTNQFKDTLEKYTQLKSSILNYEIQIHENLATVCHRLEARVTGESNEAEKTNLRENFEKDKKKYLEKHKQDLAPYYLEKSKKSLDLIYPFFVRNQGIQSFSKFTSEVQENIREIIPEESLNLLLELSQQIERVVPDLNQEG